MVKCSIHATSSCAKLNLVEGNVGLCTIHTSSDSCVKEHIGDTQINPRKSLTFINASNTGGNVVLV